MIKSKQADSFAERLMSQDIAVSGSQYETHRKELEAKLASGNVENGSLIGCVWSPVSSAFR